MSHVLHCVCVCFFFTFCFPLPFNNVHSHLTISLLPIWNGLGLELACGTVWVVWFKPSSNGSACDHPFSPRLGSRARRPPSFASLFYGTRTPPHRHLRPPVVFGRVPLKRPAGGGAGADWFRRWPRTHVSHVQSKVFAALRVKRHMDRQVYYGIYSNCLRNRTFSFAHVAYR